MRHPTSGPLASLALLTSIVLASTASPALAQPAPLGREALVDDTAGAYDDLPLLAGRPDGSFLFAYAAHDPGAGTQVWLRAGDDGGVLAAPISLVTVSRRFDVLGALAPTAPGFGVSWRDDVSRGRNRTYFQEVTADGTPVAQPLDVGGPRVTARPRPSGGVVTTWFTARALQVQCVDDDGVPLRAPTKLLLGAFDFFEPPELVEFADRSFVLVWVTLIDSQQGLRERGIFAQRFDALGRAVGRMVTVAPPAAPGDLSDWEVAGGGDHLLAVISDPGQGHVRLDTFDQRLAAIGHADLTSAGSESFAEDVAVDPGGRVLAVYSNVVDGSLRGFLRLFDRSAAPLGGAERIDTAASAAYPEIFGAMAAWAGDAWVVGWVGEGDRDALWERRFAYP